jgi:hypothetical protein
MSNPLSTNHSIAAAATVYPRREILQFSACAWLLNDIIEIRCIRGREVKSSWHLAAELPTLLHYLADLNRDGWNIYCGVNPRPARGVNKNENIKLARVLVVDFDDCELAEALRRIASAGLPLPTMVVNSGHGVHGYWRLAEPMTDMAEWRRLMKGLAVVLDSDRSIANEERILRLAGWLNVKGEPVLCYIVHACPEDVYPVETFASIIAAKIKLPNPPPLPPPSG